jgi:hypothetical protein
MRAQRLDAGLLSDQDSFGLAIVGLFQLRFIASPSRKRSLCPALAGDTMTPQSAKETGS